MANHLVISEQADLGDPVLQASVAPVRSHLIEPRVVPSPLTLQAVQQRLEAAQQQLDQQAAQLTALTQRVATLEETWWTRSWRWLVRTWRGR